MKEIRDIIQAHDEAQQLGQQTALATVVHVEGSSYRRPGARMLITEDGRLTGAISGGCLEGDALRKALLVMSRKQPMLAVYDTTDEDDARLGVGLGCDGIIHIIIEPIDYANPHNPIQLLKTAVAQRQQAVLITLFNLADRNGIQPGTCLLQLQDGTVAGKVEPAAFREVFLSDAVTAFNEQDSSIKTYRTGNSNITAFIEFLKPAVSLVIIGGGNDVMPLVKMAAIIGWQVTVIDGRANYATAQRFPSAHRVILAKPGEVLDHITVDEQTVFVLMTHNYVYDLKALRQLLNTQLVYVGILGPKKKLVRVLDELKQEGIQPTEEQLATIYGPVGLDIGAETAEEIALSIIAEIKAVLSERSGQFLRNSQEAIHARTGQSIPEITLSASNTPA
jgi:xanthine/CO dehydrogenase XdhC/CoxF family maturation factor